MTGLPDNSNHAGRTLLRWGGGALLAAGFGLLLHGWLQDDPKAVASLSQPAYPIGPAPAVGSPPVGSPPVGSLAGRPETSPFGTGCGSPFTTANSSSPNAAGSCGAGASNAKASAEVAATAAPKDWWDEDQDPEEYHEVTIPPGAEDGTMHPVQSDIKTGADYDDEIQEKLGSAYLPPDGQDQSDPAQDDTADAPQAAPPAPQDQPQAAPR